MLARFLANRRLFDWASPPLTAIWAGFLSGGEDLGLNDAVGLELAEPFC